MSPTNPAVLIDALERVESQALDEHDGFCKLCGSCPHPDGSISHAEDCPLPYVEAALGKVAR